MKDARPAWLQSIIDSSNAKAPQELLGLSIAIATSSAAHRGGPFGAIVADQTGAIVSTGWNCVVATYDSTAHAEVVALREAQRLLRTHLLSFEGEAELVLYCSSEPCIQCFGAIYWSGIKRVVAAGRKELAELYGFDEGPVRGELWDEAKRQKGIALEFIPLSEAVIAEPFHEFKKSRGILY